MAFDAGAAIGRVILDDTQYQKGAKNIAKTNKKIGTSFNALKIGAAALSAAFVASVVKANEFNKAFANVTTLVDTAAVDTAKMKNELLGLDARLGSAKELTEGLYQALSASVDPARAVEFVGDAAKFATAALTDTNTAVDAITTALNAYGLSADEAGRISDVFFQTVKRGKVTGQELASTIGSVIPTAANLGVSVEELGAAIATMTKQGVNSSEATTQLTQVMNAFIKPSETMQEKLEELGFASGSALLESEGLAGALQFLQDATGGNKEALAELLPNVRAMKGAFALTGDAAEIFEQDLLAMMDASGSVEEAFEKQEITFETLGNQIDRLMISVGEAFLPIIFDLANGLTKLFKDIQPFVGILTIVIEVIKEIGTIIADFFISGLKSIEENFKKVTTQLESGFNAFHLISGVIKLVSINFKIFSKQIDIVITSIADLIIAIAQSGETISSFFKFLVKKEPWENVKDNAKSAINAFKDFGKNIFEGTKELILDTIDEFKEFPEEVKTSSKKMENIWNITIEKIKKDSESQMQDMTDDIKENIKEIADAPEEEIIPKWKQVFSKISMAGQKFQTGFDNIGKKIINNFTNIAGSLAKIFNDIFGLVTQQMNNELEVLKAKNEKELEELEAQKEKKLELNQTGFEEQREQLEEQREQGLISQEEFDTKLIELEKKKADQDAQIEQQLNDKIANTKDKARRKENQKQKEIFEAEKANQIANVWIQTAIGIVGAWAQSIAQLGPIAGAIFAGVLTALMLGVAVAQTVVIGQQQFVPAFQTGGTVPGGPAIINEQGGELVTLPDGSVVIPHDISMQIAQSAGGGTKQIVINNSFAGAMISSDMSLRKITNAVNRELGKTLRNQL